jgi:hypothetical protein
VLRYENAVFDTTALNVSVLMEYVFPVEAVFWRTIVTGPTDGAEAVKKGKQLKLVTRGFKSAVAETQRLYEEPSDKSFIGLTVTRSDVDLVTESGNTAELGPAYHTYVNFE